MAFDRIPLRPVSPLTPELVQAVLTMGETHPDASIREIAEGLNRALCRYPDAEASRLAFEAGIELDAQFLQQGGA